MTAIFINMKENGAEEKNFNGKNGAICYATSGSENCERTVQNNPRPG